MSKTFYVPPGIGPLAVENFPDGCKRTVEGALHIRPRSSIELTDDEVTHLNQARPALMAKLRDITFTEGPPAEATSKPPDKPDKSKKGKGGRRTGGPFLDAD